MSALPPISAGVRTRGISGTIESLPADHEFQTGRMNA